MKTIIPFLSPSLIVAAWILIEKSPSMPAGTWQPVETVTPGHLGWFRRTYVHNGDPRVFYRVKELP